MLVWPRSRRHPPAKRTRATSTWVQILPPTLMIQQAYRVLGVHYDQKYKTYALQIDSKGVEDPTYKGELLLITKHRKGGDRIGTFRDQEWYVQGTIAKGFITLYHDYDL